MANNLETTNLNPANGYVGSSSRYMNGTIAYYGRQRKLTFTLYSRKKYTTSSSDRWWVIPPGYARRPDMVSYLAYGVPDFWWAIMEANGIFDVMDFKAGLNIWIPGNVYGR